MDKLMNLINSALGRNQQVPEKPVITISREKGSGGRPIAYMTAEKLGEPWKVYHQETLEQIAREKEMNTWFTQQVEASAEPQIKKIIDQALDGRYGKLDQYYQTLIRLLAIIGYRGHAIIVGRGANFLFPQALKVRLICTLEQRIQWIMEFEHVSHKEAVHLIEQSDQQREDFIRGIFGVDQKIPHHYDLIIKTSYHIKLKDAADTIVHLARRRYKL